MRVRLRRSRWVIAATYCSCHSRRRRSVVRARAAGNPPPATRCSNASPSLPPVVIGNLPPKILSIKPVLGARPPISTCVSGPKRRTSIRPARESASFGSRSTLAEPVRISRPGRRSRSTSPLIDVNSSGMRCTSSNTVRSGNSVQNPTGSARAARRTFSSSNVK